MDTELCNRNTQCHYKVSGEDRKIWVKYSHVILEHREILHNLSKCKLQIQIKFVEIHIKSDNFGIGTNSYGTLS